MSRFKRDLSGMRNPPKTGPPEKHSAYAELRRYRERKTDMRTADDKALAAWKDAIVNDCGGAEGMDAFQLSMLDRAVECLIVLRCMSNYVEKTGIMDAEGSLVACLRHSFLAYQNSFRLALQAIYERADKRPPKPPDLDDYLKNNYGDGEPK